MPHMRRARVEQVIAQVTVHYGDNALLITNADGTPIAERFDLPGTIIDKLTVLI